MRLEEWIDTVLLENGHYSREYWEGECDAAKRAWNDALEEAAKVADNGDSYGVGPIAASYIANEIRSLKEE